VTMTPCDYWRRCHAIQHATSGNLERRGIGDIKTLIAAGFRALIRMGTGSGATSPGARR
jgi:omega-6 fatty acid desaturase (delta-12 desaturase)